MTDNPLNEANAESGAEATAPTPAPETLPPATHQAPPNSFPPPATSPVNQSAPYQAPVASPQSPQPMHPNPGIPQPNFAYNPNSSMPQGENLLEAFNALRNKQIFNIRKQMPAKADDFPNPLLLLALLKSVLSGIPQESFRASAAAKKTWLLGLLSFCVVGGVLEANIFYAFWSGVKSRTDSLLGSLYDLEKAFSGSSSMKNASSNLLGFSLEDWLSHFLRGALLGLVIFFLTALVLYWTACLRKNKVSFPQAASAYLVSALPLLAVCSISAIILLIPIQGLTILLTPLLMIIGAAAAFAQIIWGFEWVKSLPNTYKSPVIPYVLLTALAQAISFPLLITIALSV